MNSLGSWLGKALLFVAATLMGVACARLILARMPNLFFVILAVWILSIVFARRTTPRVDSPSHFAHTLWSLLVVATSAAHLYLVIHPAFEQPKSGGGPGSVCRARMRNLSVAMSLYLKEYGGTYPPADRWAEALSPHLTKLWKCPDSKASYSYGMNEALGGRRRDQVSDPESTMLFFEMDSTDRNAHGTSTDLALRHGAGYVFVSVDGALRYSTRHKMSWRP